MAGAVNTLLQLALVYCVLIVLILMCRGAITRLAGARWAYAMWITLLLPPVIMTLPGALVLPFIPLTVQQLSISNHMNWLGSSSTLNAIAAASLAIWAVGMAAAFWRTARANAKLHSVIRFNSHQLSEDQVKLVNSLCRRSGVFPYPLTQFSTEVGAPALLGVIRPVLLLPVRFFEHFNRSEQQLVIFHELVHYQRKDVWSNLLFDILRCVFWFNPLVALAEKRFRLDQELACDQSVLCDEPRSQKIHYAKALLKAASPSYSNSLLGFRNNSPEIVSRVRLLEHHKVSPLQPVVGVTSIVLLLILAILLSAPLMEGGSPFSVVSSWCNVYQNLRF